jgi:hypothetical protein
VDLEEGLKERRAMFQHFKSAKARAKARMDALFGREAELLRMSFNCIYEYTLARKHSRTLLDRMATSTLKRITLHSFTQWAHRHPVSISIVARMF